MLVCGEVKVTTYFHFCLSLRDPQPWLFGEDRDRHVCEAIFGSVREGLPLTFGVEAIKERIYK